MPMTRSRGRLAKLEGDALRCCARAAGRGERPEAAPLRDHRGGEEAEPPGGGRAGGAPRPGRPRPPPPLSPLNTRTAGPTEAAPAPRRPAGPRGKRHGVHQLPLPRAPGEGPPPTNQPSSSSAPALSLACGNFWHALYCDGRAGPLSRRRRHAAPVPPPHRGPCPRSSSAWSGTSRPGGAASSSSRRGAPAAPSSEPTGLPSARAGGPPPRPESAPSPTRVRPVSVACPQEEFAPPEEPPGPPQLTAKAQKLSRRSAAPPPPRTPAAATHPAAARRPFPLPRPRACRRPSPAPRSLGDLYAWEEHRQLRLLLVKRQAEDRELAEVTFTPVISERSQARCGRAGPRAQVAGSALLCGG